jgi:thioredoxin 2
VTERAVYLRCDNCGAVNKLPENKLMEHPRCGKCKSFLELRRVPIDATSGNFDREALSWPGAVLVEFWSPRCGHCLRISPVIDEIAREKAGILKVVKVNVDSEPALGARFAIRGTPMFILYQHGNKVSDIPGAPLADQLKAWIDASLLGS